MSSSLASSLTIRDAGQPTTSEAVSEPPMRICSGCGLTEGELNRTGLLGCARCYVTFAALIAAAVEELHGLRVPTSYIESPAPRQSITNPWPTRRSIRL